MSKTNGRSPASTRRFSPWPICFRSKSAFWDSTEDWTNLTTPTVSTIIEPVDQEGREAAEMLLALLDGSGEPGEQRILECKLNWLDSTSI